MQIYVILWSKAPLDDPPALAYTPRITQSGYAMSDTIRQNQPGVFYSLPGITLHDSRITHS